MKNVIEIVLGSLLIFVEIIFIVSVIVYNIDNKNVIYFITDEQTEVIEKYGKKSEIYALTTIVNNTGVTATAISNLYSMVGFGMGTMFIFIGVIDLCIVIPKQENGKR